MLMEQQRPRDIISIPSSESESSSAAGTPVRGQHSWRAPIPSLSGSLNVSESTDFELHGLAINSLSCGTIIEEDANIQKIASNLGSMGMQPLYSLVEDEEDDRDRREVNGGISLADRSSNEIKDEISALDSFPFDSSKMMSTSSKLGSERLDDSHMDISEKSLQFNSGKIPIGGHSTFHGSTSNQLIQQSFRSPHASGRSNIPGGSGHFPKAFGSEKDGEGTSSIRSDAERKLFQEFEINNSDSMRSKDGLMFTSEKSDQYDRVFSSSRSELDVSAEKRLLHTFLPGHMVNSTSAINPDSVKSVETIDPFGMDVSAKSFNDSYRSDMSTDSVTRRQLLDFLEKTESGKSLDDGAKRMLMDYFDRTESAKSTDSISKKELFDHFENSEHMRKMDTHTRNRFFEGFAEFNVGYPYFNISKPAQPQTSSFSLGSLFQQPSAQQQHPQIFDSNYQQQQNQEYHNSILSGIWMSKQNHKQQHDEIPLHQDGTFSEKYRSSVVDETSATTEQPHRRTSFSGVMPQLWHKKPHKSPIVAPSQPEIVKEFPPLQQQHLQQQQQQQQQQLLYSNGIVPSMSYSLQPQQQPQQQPQPVGNMYSLGPHPSGTMLTSTSLPALASAPMVQVTPSVFNFPYATLNSNTGVARLPPILNPAVNGTSSMSLQQLQQAQQYALLQQSSPSPRLLPPLSSGNPANGHSFYSANSLNGTPLMSGSTSIAAPTVTTTVSTADGQCIEILKPVHKEKQSASNATVGSSSSVSVAARGAYRCGRCGQRKVDHVCKFVDKTYKSRGAQVYHPIYNLATNTPFPGEKFLTIRPRTTIHDTPALAPTDTTPSNSVGMASPQGVAASASVTMANLTGQDIQAILLRAKLHADSMAKQEMHDEEHYMKSSVSISVHQSMKHPNMSSAHIDLAKDSLDEEDDEEQGEFRNNDALEGIEAEYRGHEAMDQDHDFLPEPAFTFGSQLSFRFLTSKATASSTSEKKRTLATDHTGKFTPNTSVKFSKSNSFFSSPANAARYAANVIQRYWRGYRVRKQYPKRRNDLQKSSSFFVSPAEATRYAANIIQRYWRGYRVRKHMSEDTTP